jgi:hypothetical protein
VDHFTRHSLSSREHLSTVLHFLRCHYGSSIKDQLELTRNQWERLIKGKAVDLDRYQETLQRLGLTPLTLKMGNVDPGILINHLEGQRDYLPSSYKVAAFSSKKIGRSLMELLERFYGTQLKHHLLASLQIGPQFFESEHTPPKVSTILYSNIYKLLKSSYGFSDQDLYWLGQKTTETDLSPHWEQRYNASSLVDAYTDYLDQITLFVEQSYSYELHRLNAKEVVFRKRPGKQMQEILNTKVYGNHESCVYSMGFTSTVGYYSQGQYPKAKKTKCLYEGDDCSEFTVSLNDFSSPPYFPHGTLLQ